MVVSELIQVWYPLLQVQVVAVVVDSNLLRVLLSHQAVQVEV
jgi:hypothetical protein